MHDIPDSEPALVAPPRFSPADVESILLRNHWLSSPAANPSPELSAWLARASVLLSPQSSGIAQLESLLRLIFEYDAARALSLPENQDILTREGAREVIREFSNLLLDVPALDSDSFKSLIESVKRATPFRSRELFQPIRLALTGHSGGGEFDRVILLLDSASTLDFQAPVKSSRQRIVEFLSALD